MAYLELQVLDSHFGLNGSRKKTKGIVLHVSMPHCCHTRCLKTPSSRKGSGPGHLPNSPQQLPLRKITGHGWLLAKQLLCRGVRTPLSSHFSSAKTKESEGKNTKNQREKSQLCLCMCPGEKKALCFSTQASEFSGTLKTTQDDQYKCPAAHDLTNLTSRRLRENLLGY